MTKTFLRLYLLLVFAIIGTGYGLDRLWQSYLDERSPDQIEPEPLLALASAYLQSQPVTDWPQHAVTLNQQFSARLRLVPSSTFSASTDIAGRLQQGQTVTLADQADARISVRQLADPAWLLIDTLPTAPEQSRMELLLLVVFYLFIAVVVLLWVWPLSQALRRLEIAAVAFGTGDWSAKAEVKNRSPVAPLAMAFNQMANRISQLIRSNQELSHAVSHELRTPLARMKFALAMANESSDEAVRQKNLASISQDVVEMDALVNELLRYASFDREERSLNLQRGDFRALVTEKLEQLSTSCDRALTISFDCQAPDGTAICDFHLLERAVQNLLQNACRFARQRIVVTFARHDGQYQLTVDDDGPGVPADARERVFEAFVRLDNSGHHGGGFGLGLAIVQRIAQWHGGQAKVSDSPSGGARFLLHWPCPETTAATVRKS